MRYADFDGEETLEKTTKDKDIENSTTQVDLNLTECLGMRYEVSDNEETYVVHWERKSLTSTELICPTNLIKLIQKKNKMFSSAIQIVWLLTF